MGSDSGLLSWARTLAIIHQDNRPVRCGCGRKTSADMMMDVRALPATLRGERDYICDACRERLVLQGRITREDLYRQLGAPAEVLARMRAKDAAARAGSGR